MRRPAVLAALLVLAVCGQARAALFLGADTSIERGYVKLFAVGSSDFGPLTYQEGTTALGTLALSQPIGSDARYGALSAGAVDRAARWRCDRLDRHFAVTGTRADGTQETATYAVRTPSCRDRLTLAAPARVKAGDVATVTVTDTWGTGDAAAELCTRKPGARARCALLRFQGAVATFAFTPHARTRYRVTVRAPAQRLRREVAVGVPARPQAASDAGPVVLATGDSMMQSIDAILADRLAGRADVREDVKVGAAISSDQIVDWPQLARRQVAARHPQATVVFLGTNDRYPMTTAAGASVGCCGPDWAREYTRRVRGIMRTYAQSGRGTVTWLTIPAAKDAARAAAQRVVNAALVEAAAGLPTVDVLDVAEIFTPGGTYRPSIAVDGKRVHVRESDGLHLNIAGARIAVRAIIARLGADGIL